MNVRSTKLNPQILVMKHIKGYCEYLLLVLCATVWIALIAVVPDFLDNPTHGFRGVAAVACYVAAVSVVSLLVLYAAGLNKWVATVFYPLYGMLGAGVSYYRIAYGVTVTPLIVDCVFHTNPQEAVSVMSWQLVAWIALNACVSVLFVLWRWKISAPKYAYLHAAGAILLLVGYYHCNGRLHQSLSQRYPIHIVESLRMYRVLQQDRGKERTTPMYISEPPKTDSLDIVVVLGESMRSDHLQLNGYPRETNPLLSQRKNVVAMPNIYSQYTYTAASVPVIMTRADSVHPELQYSENSFISILRQEGYHTAWISNKEIDRSYAHFSTECDTAFWVNAGKSVFVYSGWYDEEMLPYLDIQMTDNHPRRFVLMHCIGSHWYYNNHVPEGHDYFQPVTDNRVVTNNTREQVVNSYDNTARYVDFFVDSVIWRLEDRCAILIYLSDHGESLGEDGNWLHASGAEETKHPACIVWYSDRYAETYPDKVRALHENSARRYLTDFMFHSVLSTAEIYIPDARGMDIFQSVDN